ncbi:magnesium-translocating P-type ATPase [Collinsella sp. AF08-23]|uniref:magnesium-translocating P-type ATPase n=1 Tax=Collinsella sp. AF08-23 TaxID=2292211 RepID=UPI000E522AF6|nr:magnesium-translocating P-type ATPase [Collinsella sp. AF08-23]RHS39429.1 HAD family hydrolase [Collinsella sp. AF08-23]
MTWMKHTVQNEQANLGRNPLAVSGIARPTKTHMRRGIHRIIGSVSAHVRHSVSSAAAARRTEGLDPEIARIGALEAAEVMDLLGCGPRGLTEQQAHRIRSVHGANIIAPEHHDPLAARLSRAFLTPFTLILLALAAISLYTNVYLAAPGDEDPSTAIIIGVMVLISGGISFWQDTRGAAAADALKGLVSITCRCVREDTGAAEIPLADVVPGDLIELAAGDIIPADLRIVTAKDLFLTQAALTGESDPVEKTPAAIAEPAGRALVIDDCTNFAFAGTTVQSGSGTGVVVTTGARTYLGGIASALDSRPTTTSFDAGVASVSRVLVGFMLVMCPIVFVLCGLTKGDWLDALLFSISVAVGITPQMLPVIVTTCLARGAEAMRAKDVVVKEISSIQNLGAMDVLCCDKTGTLTRDKIVLERHLDVLGAPSDRVLRHAYLNSLFQTGLRNLMDEAIIERAEALAAGGRSMDARAGRTSPGTPGQAGAGASPAAPRRTSPEANAIAAAREQWRLVDEIPFDFDRRRMSVVVADGTGKRQLITKGAVEEMIDVCSEVEVGADVLPLTPEQAGRILDRVRGLNERGMRVVGVAQRNDVPARDLTADDERDMTLIGYLAFLDPPKASAKAAVDELSGLGVTVKVLTGDNAAVAATVCEQVGINARNMLTGADIDMLSDDELAERAERTGLFAKLSPLQKARIVNVLRERGGKTVGFMGDGINDAAAMRASDCGISVDTAVDVAKESADIILLKKDLTVLAHGIVEGRRTYGNTIKYIKTTASSNFGNVLSVLAAAAFLPFLPMSALQLLLLGMAYTVSCAALPWDNVDESFLACPRTWDARGIVSFMLGLGPVSSIFDILTFAAMFWVVCPLVVGAPWAALTDPAQRALFALVFQTGWFVESMWTQTLVIHLLRTERLPFVQSRPAASLTLLTMLGVGLVTAMPYVPGVNSALDLVPLPGVFFGVLAAMMAGYLLLTSIAKALYVRAHGELL